MEFYMKLPRNKREFALFLLAFISTTEVSLSWVLFKDTSLVYGLRLVRVSVVRSLSRKKP